MTTFIRNTKMWAAATLTALSLGAAVLTSTSPATDAAIQRSDVVAVSTLTILTSPAVREGRHTATAPALGQSNDQDDAQAAR